MTDTTQRQQQEDARPPELSKPVVNSKLFRPAGYNPRHPGESWLHWKFREAFARP